MSPTLCPVHGIPLVCVCPACNGQKGGRVRSVAKAKASRLNPLGHGRPRIYPQCTRYRVHRFNPVTGVCYGCDFKRPRKPKASLH